MRSEVIDSRSSSPGRSILNSGWTPLLGSDVEDETTDGGAVLEVNGRVAAIVSCEFQSTHRIIDHGQLQGQPLHRFLRLLESLSAGFSCRAEACGRGFKCPGIHPVPRSRLRRCRHRLSTSKARAPLREGLFDAFKRQACDFGFKIMRALDVDLQNHRTWVFEQGVVRPEKSHGDARAVEQDALAVLGCDVDLSEAAAQLLDRSHRAIVL